MPYASTIVVPDASADEEDLLEDCDESCGDSVEMTQAEMEAEEAAQAAKEAKKTTDDAQVIKDAKAVKDAKVAEQALLKLVNEELAAKEKVAADAKAAAKKLEEERKAEALKLEAEQKLSQEQALKQAEEPVAEEKINIDQTATSNKLEEERKRAEALKLEAEQKLSQEQALKQAEAEALAKAQADLLAKQMEEKRLMEEQEKFLQSISTTSENREIVAAVKTAETPKMIDANSNGVPDDLETSLGIDTKKVDEEMVTINAQLAVREQTLISAGSSRAEAATIIKKELTKKKAENKISTIRKVAAAKYGSKIVNSKQDSRGDGSSDEVAVLMGVNPKTKGAASDEFFPVEKKLYGIDTKTSNITDIKKCTMSIATGNKLPSKGFTVLAACPKNKTFTLYMLGKNGRSVELKTAKSSENSKLVFTVEQGLVTGKSIFYIKEAKQVTGFLPSLWFASTLGAESDTETTSDPVVVDIVQETEIEQPVVKNIENIDVAGLKDIKISATADGKVHVTGLADISTMVIGTFSSAVFTSAILADVENGSFEITSARPLEAGDHEVVIYATRPEDSVQSPPVKLRFSIIPVALAATGETMEVRQVASENTGAFPVVPVASGAAVVLVALVIVYVKKARKA